MSCLNHLYTEVKPGNKKTAENDCLNVDDATHDGVLSFAFVVLFRYHLDIQRLRENVEGIKKQTVT